MADVFLSYSSKDREKAKLIERALTSAGYEVFWDQEVPVGTDWNRWIGGKLREGRVAVVLWSRHSVESGNVIHEATIANNAGKLIPVVVDTLAAEQFPMGFYTVQGADLRNYRGGDSPEMSKLLAAVAAKIGGAHEPPIAKARSAPVALIAGGVLAVLVAGAAGVYALNRPKPPAIEQPSIAPADFGKAQEHAATLSGDYRWTGIACGDGPHMVLDDTARSVVVTMKNTPTYRHAIESANGDTLRTVIVEPESERGQEYELTRKGDALTVKNVTTGQVDEWEACP